MSLERLIKACFSTCAVIRCWNNPGNSLAVAGDSSAGTSSRAQPADIAGTERMFSFGWRRSAWLAFCRSDQLVLKSAASVELPSRRARKRNRSLLRSKELSPRSFDASSLCMPSLERFPGISPGGEFR